MRVLLVGFENGINVALNMLSGKYATSSDDIVEVCLWNDSNSIYQFFHNQDSIYDWYIVAGGDKMTSKEISTQLRDAFHIPDDRIIDYSLFYEATMPFLHTDRMLGIPGQLYDGIILGISHAEVGIIPELLNGSYVNLALSSQDLYYNLKTLEYCMEHYPEKFVGLNHIIIDMFDYTYFNYDVSRSKTFYEYIKWGGFQEDAHNYVQNKNFDYDLSMVQGMIMEKLYEGITDEKIDVWCDMFEDVHDKDGYKEYSTSDYVSRRNRVVTDVDVDEFKVETSIVVKRFEDTIAENKSIFRQLIETIQKINPQMRITCILLPRYSKVQEKSVCAYESWKQEFYDIMECAKQQYGIEFIDFKNHEIASRAELFFDVSHFNYVGAMKFSKLLADTLEKMG